MKSCTNMSYIPESDIALDFHFDILLNFPMAMLLVTTLQVRIINTVGTILFRSHRNFFPMVKFVKY